MILLLILRQLFFCLYYRQNITSALFYKGFNAFFSHTNLERKSFFRLIYELERLSIYWRAWPDSYFRQRMFLKENTDLNIMKTFVPQDVYNKYAIDLDSRFHILVDDKILCHDILSYYQLPVTTRYFIFRNNEFRCGNRFLLDSEIDTIIGTVLDERIFCKCYTGGAGSGVSIFIRKNGRFIDNNNNVLSAAMIRRVFKDKNYIFEKQILQDKTLSQFNPDTVNTIRVLTYKNKIISATVRFGGKGDFLDNVSLHGVAVSIDLTTGLLGDFGYNMYKSSKIFEHPDSHILFKGTRIEQWPQVKDLVVKVLKFLPYYTSVGFDIATTVDGPVIVEINTGAGINLSQVGRKEGLASAFIQK